VADTETAPPVSGTGEGLATKFEIAGGTVTAATVTDVDAFVVPLGPVALNVTG
jgi:hypothetical protein